MSKKFDRNCISLLEQIISDKQFQQQFSLSRKAAMEMVRRQGWADIFAGIEPLLAEITCTDILDLCRPTMDELAAEPQEGWLSFTYHYAINLSYPSAAFISTAAAYIDAALFFLAIMQVTHTMARKKGLSPDYLEIKFIDDIELIDSEYVEEYIRIKNQFSAKFIYEMMWLGRIVTPFKTLEHIAGVHNLAVSIGRQLKKSGTPVDLALLSGAAAVHDIGKFGCKEGECVPYLHYYYTAHWCKDNNATAIGHIAANHSAWDLELENLSSESLLLIYADFRVKQIIDDRGLEHTELYTLDQSFEVILHKLDNVDEAKRQRYLFVYAKLHDFEDYMRSLGVDVDMRGEIFTIDLPDINLMSPDQIIESFKFLGIEHNIALMHRFGTERLFGNILEAARSEKNWKNLRAYIGIFEEYFTYLGINQKVNTLSFLYELLMHREGDIRRQAAKLIGNIIAHFDDGYRKELPQGIDADADEPTALIMWRKYLQMIILPDHKLTAQHKSWIGYSLKIVVGSTLEYCRSQDRKQYFTEIWSYFHQPELLESTSVFVLLDALNYFPLDMCDDAAIDKLSQFAIYGANQESLELKTAALRVLRRITESDNASTFNCWNNIFNFVTQLKDHDHPTMIFLKGRLLRAFGMDDSGLQAILQQRNIVSDIFLDNLKMATPWIIKAVNIKLLLDQIDRGCTDHLLHIAAHFSNMLKVSERVVLRHDAGGALVRIAPLLELDQRNEIATELVKGLEVGEYEFSKYIPEYLGQFALWLHPKELNELISRLESQLSNESDSVVSVTLDTAGVLLECYSQYRCRFAETEEDYRGRQKRLLGILLRGLSCYRPGVRQEALLVIGKSLFASKRLDEVEKRRIFTICHKKLLFLITENLEGGLTFFYRAAALNNIYRFIAENILNYGGFAFEEWQKIAFFPGTFDPFTLSHKGIVQAISNLGFEVMIAIDEFSWSKNAQPRQIRRQIASMSLAAELNVHIFPDASPINIANPDDLRQLKDIFPKKNVYVVVGSDVVTNASSYKQSPKENSIHHANHIIFSRGYSADDANANNHDNFSCIDGDIINLSLPIHLEDISSTKIRENIDQNRDISNLIDSMVQEYIYYNSLYLREPQYKPLLKTQDLRFETIEKPNNELINKLTEQFIDDPGEAKAVMSAIKEREDKLILLKTSAALDSCQGFIVFRELASAELLHELKNVAAAELVRRKASGHLLLISGIYILPSKGIEVPEQLLLTEVLDYALRNDCTYALFHTPTHTQIPTSVIAVLERQGFVKAELNNQNYQLYMTNMRAPLVLIQNIETTIKEPLASNRKVLDAIRTAHQKLQTAMTKMYQGNLVLSLSSGVIYHRLIGKITELNMVPAYPVQPSQLGPFMCVPFGKILRGKAIPNTVTKTLHTDKVFEPDIQSSCIEAYPYYASLENQIRTIKSFRRPVIMVDDLLHGSDRMKALTPLFAEQNIDIKMVLVGLLSGRGRDLMTIMNKQADSIYYVPNLRNWFVESSLYPFIGGDTVRRENRKVAGLLPSVNLIFPYAAPPLQKYCDRSAIFELSLTCLENARDILIALETEYRLIFAKNLTLNRLSEAINLPLCPDKGNCMNYDANLAASVYVENDIEMLLRSRSVFE